MRKTYLYCMTINFLFLFFTLIVSKGILIVASVIFMFAAPWLCVVPVSILKKLNILSSHSLKVYSGMSGALIFLLMCLSPIQDEEIGNSEFGVIVLLYLLAILASVVSAFATYYFSSEYKKRAGI